jgi:hypothetical protein
VANGDQGTGLGARFFLRIAGVCLLLGLVAFVIALLSVRALIAWGILGFFVFLAVVLFVGAWLIDRHRQADSY